VRRIVRRRRVVARVTTETPAPLTRRQLRELEANGRFAAPAPANAAPAVPVPSASVAAAPAPELPKTEAASAGIFASLPLVVEASMTELHVEEIAGEEPSIAPPMTIEVSQNDDSVASAPATDPFLTEIFGELLEPAEVQPSDIPVDGMHVTTTKRSRAARPAKSRPAKAPKQAKAPKAPKTTRADRPSRAEKRKARPASKILSVAALLFSGALFVGMSVPANAFMTFAAEEGNTITAAESAAVPVQKVAVAADASMESLTRDEFSVTSYSEVLTAKYGTKIYSFNPTTGSIRWPFPYAVPVSSGFGDRVAPCRGCSSQHQGVDFTPGTGTPIYAVADGVVTQSTFGGAFGQHALLDHVINGQKVQTLYAHMISGSSPLKEGDPIKVGDFIGLVGTTGASTGAHLHLEVHLDGVPVDPFAWLEANATN
jgi:murein DD-endopeptidase MepM/ murein hydrolase activator NlpD